MTASTETATKHKILLLDDDPDVLELYQDMLLQLPSKPEVHIASSGARAMALLDSEIFNVLICDLNMPKMDGLQVIAIVRRKYPQLRTVIITGATDEAMRARAYAMGIDLFLEKPSNQKELGFFMDCVESLLDKEQTAGFRGVQSKTLVDLIQLECLSGSSSVLKITNGKIDARIWIQHGELIDAEAPNLEGEDAFKHILSWKTGNFEILPAEPDRQRRIFVSYQGLLLDSAQAQDEAVADGIEPLPTEQTGSGGSDTQFLQKAGLGRMRGVEFALKLPHDLSVPIQKWGLENTEPLITWTRSTVSAFQQVGDKFRFGQLQELDARGLQRQVRIIEQSGTTIVIGLLPNATREQIDESAQKVLERWGS